MSLVYCDSFDHYTTVTDKGWVLGTLPTLGMAAAYARFSQGLFIRGGGGNPQGQIYRPITPGSSWVVGMALRPSNQNSGANNTAGLVLAFSEDATLHCELRVDASRRLVVTRNGTVLGTGTTPLALMAWHYVEFKLTIDDTAGVAVVKLNGATEINLSSQDTRNAGTGLANRLNLYGHDTTAWEYDDLYLLDAAGSVNNDFLGDIRVQALLPNNNGNSSQLLGSDGNSTDNYLLVDESPPNADTDYVESATVGQKDTYAYGNLTATSGSVLAVVPQMRMRKTDAGARSIASVARLAAGTEADSASQVLSDTYVYMQDVRETKPGGGAWAIADVNGAEFGVKITV